MNLNNDDDNDFKSSKIANKSEDKDVVPCVDIRFNSIEAKETEEKIPTNINMLLG